MFLLHRGYQGVCFAERVVILGTEYLLDMKYFMLKQNTLAAYE